MIVSGEGVSVAGAGPGSSGRSFMSWFWDYLLLKQAEPYNSCPDQSYCIF